MRMGSRGHQARAACAAPLPALLPTPEGLRQRHAHGVNGVYTILGFFFFYFFFLFFIFVGIQKWVTIVSSVLSTMRYFIQNSSFIFIYI
jgi:hypothetical protein